MCNSDSLRLDEYLRQTQKLSWEYVTTEEIFLFLLVLQHIGHLPAVQGTLLS